MKKTVIVLIILMLCCASALAHWRFYYAYCTDTSHDNGGPWRSCWKETQEEANREAQAHMKLAHHFGVTVRRGEVDFWRLRLGHLPGHGEAHSA
jgi:hypothetical protein